MNLDPTRTVRDFALEFPNATRLFEKLGIDYCCGGGKPLQTACADKQISVADVLRSLEQDNFITAANTESADFNQQPLKELIEHIVTRHHGYVRQEIPRLQQLLNKVVSVHGSTHPELAGIQQNFRTLADELTSHMMKEEQILFPYIAAMEQAFNEGKPARRPMFGTVGNPVHMMEMEHDSAGALLREISAASGSYTPPENACFSYRTLYTGLKDFEADLHQHIHLENNILFPKAVALEEQVNATASVR